MAWSSINPYWLCTTNTGNLTLFELGCASSAGNLDPHFISHTEMHVRALNYIWRGYGINTAHPHRVVMNCFCRRSGAGNTILRFHIVPVHRVQHGALLPGWNGFYVLKALLYSTIPGRCVSALIVNAIPLSIKSSTGRPCSRKIDSNRCTTVDEYCQCSGSKFRTAMKHNRLGSGNDCHCNR